MFRTQQPNEYVWPGASTWHLELIDQPCDNVFSAYRSITKQMLHARSRSKISGDDLALLTALMFKVHGDAAWGVYVEHRYNDSSMTINYNFYDHQKLSSYKRIYTRGVLTPAEIQQ